jgi:hypothetical protein
MPPIRHMLRRSTLWSAVCIFLAQPALAQLETKVTPALPALPSDSPSDSQVTQDTSPTVCRSPPRQSDSRLLGPKVCRTQRQWDELHAKGLDIGADGKSIVASEKYRSLNPSACGSAVGCN